MSSPPTLSGVRTWTRSPSTRRPHQAGEGADPGALSHQLDDTALQAAINNSRPPDRGQPHEMRLRSLLPDRGNSKPVSPKHAQEGRGSPERPWQDMRKTLLSGTKREGVWTARHHLPRGESIIPVPAPLPHNKRTYHSSSRVLAIPKLT